MQKTAWYELGTHQAVDDIVRTPRSASGRPGRGRKRPLVWATSRPTIRIDVLIVPHPRHAPPGTVGSPEYKDEPSIAAQEYQKCVSLSEALSGAAGVQAGAAQV